MTKKRGKLIFALVILLVIAYNVKADSPPNVTLNAPSNSATVQTPAIFNFLVEDDNDIANCRLWGNFSGTWQLEQTKTFDSMVYQETANESFVGIATDAVDGNWNTYEARDDLTYYMNYTKLSGKNGALWTISGGVLADKGPTNYTVPQDCWDYDANKLIFKAVTNEGYSGHSYWYCYNGSWKIVKDFNGGRGFWEEAVWWSESAAKQNTVIDFASISPATGYYKWNVQCYDNANQDDWGDANWTVLIVAAPAAAAAAGGGGKAEEPEVLVGEEIPAIEPEEGMETLTSEQVDEVRSITQVSYEPKVYGSNLVAGSFSVGLENLGDKIVKDIDVVVEKPPADERPTLTHIYRIFGWEEQELTGWTTSNYVQEPQLLEWEVSEPQHYSRLVPGEIIDVDLGVKTPLTREDMVELNFNVLSFGKVVYSETVPMEIDTAELLVVADVHSEENLADIYMIVSNQKDEDSAHYVELNFNKDGKTTGAEYFGPYKIGSNDVQLFAYQYQYNDEFADDYTLKYTLYDMEGEVKEAVGEVRLTE